MSQTVPPGFATQDALDSKAIDYAFVIAGWPVIYTVAKSSYAFAGNFIDWGSMTVPTNPAPSIQSWASVPDCVGISAKGRPEEGSFTLGQVDIDVLDRRLNGKHAITDLLSRQSYILANQNTVQARNVSLSSAGTITVGPVALTATISNSTSTIPVTSLAGFSPNGGLAYIGQECVYYTGTTLSAGPELTGCNRGWLMTSATPHPGPTFLFNGTNPKASRETPKWPGAVVYPFMPSIFRRRGYLYKGYQNLTLDQWAPAFGGFIGGVSRQGSKVTFSLFDTMAQVYGKGEQSILGPSSYFSGSGNILTTATIASDMLSGDYQTTINVADSGSTSLGNANRLLDTNGHRMAITSTS